jgi:hypothetical protein
MIPAMVVFLLPGFIAAGLYYDWNKSEWASWVQAIGSIAALLITGFLFLIQRRSEMTRALDADLFSRTLAAKNIASIAYQAVSVMDHAANEHETDTEHGVFEESAARMDHIRAILDNFVTPQTDHIASVAALQLGLFLTQASADFRNHNDAVLDHIISRSRRRVQDAERFRDRLIGHQNQLIEKCERRGIRISSQDFPA